MEIENKQYDAIVMGGGLAGVCAAIALSREGMKTALIQDRPVLGGNSSAEIGVPLGSADHRGRNRHSRETGILDELIAANAAFPNPSDPKTSQGFSGGIWSLVLWAAVRKEENITLYLNSVAKEPVIKNNRIESILVEQSTTETCFQMTAKVFLDCSGDGRVAFESGAKFMRGRESRDQYNESMALEKADDHTMGNSVYMRARDTGKPVPFKAPDWAYKFPTDDDFPGALIDCPHNPKLLTGYPGGYWWIEFGGMFDTIKDAEYIRDELFRYTVGVWDHIKNHGDHGAENYVLEAINIVPGKRESRRFIGDLIMIQADVEGKRTHGDTVAYGGWNIDLHYPKGISGGKDARYWHGHDLNLRYGIPLSALYSVNIENLLFAGRNISATHVAFGSTRVMATCAVMGQAIGNAAALCIKHNHSPREIKDKHIKELQQQLLWQDAYLPGIKNEDSNDHARHATVTASSQSPLSFPEPTEYRAVNTLTSQSFACPNGDVSKLTLPLENTSGKDMVVKLNIHRADIVDLFPGEEILSSAEATLPPGKSELEFVLPAPLSRVKGFLQVCLEPQPDLLWGYSAEEVVATQAIFQSDYDAVIRRIRGTYCLKIDPQVYCFNPEQIVSGVCRPEADTNIWISEKGMPQWLELRWPQPVCLDTVQIIFDNNLDRPIRRVHDFIVTPELVKSYDIQAENDKGEWTTLLSVADNERRRCRHHFEKTSTTALKFNFHSTNGASEIRVYEIRAMLLGKK